MQNDSKTDFIPVNQPVISAGAKRYAQECLETAWISSAGSFVPRFEEAFARYIGMPHAIAVSSGTAALHLALLASGIREGDEVIVPAFTMIAPVFAVLYTGATPVFVDCTLDTFNLDVTQIERKITSRTKAIIAVHLFGHPCDMNAILDIARRHHLTVIEDAAEAHGSLYHDKVCGSLGDLSCFSFYANKLITTGEGGMILTRNPEWAEKLKSLRDLGHSKTRFIHQDLGYNYRLTNIQAALGLGELENIDRYIDKKIHIAARYSQKLISTDGIRPPLTLPGIRNTFWVYGVLIESTRFGLDKNAFRHALRENGVETRDFFYPPSQQPVLTQRLGAFGEFPNAVSAAHNGCYLPGGLGITDEQIDRVLETIKKIRR